MWEVGDDLDSEGTTENEGSEKIVKNDVHRAYDRGPFDPLLGATVIPSWDNF